MRRLLWGRSARLDVDEIAEFYATIDPALSRDLCDSIATEPLVLIDHPHMGSPIGGGLRKWPVKRTSFVLLYAVVGNDVQVRRVRHAAQDWKPTIRRRER